MNKDLCPNIHLWGESFRMICSEQLFPQNGLVKHAFDWPTETLSFSAHAPLMINADKVSVPNTFVQLLFSWHAIIPNYTSKKKQVPDFNRHLSF